MASGLLILLVLSTTVAVFLLTESNKNDQKESTSNSFLTTIESHKIIPKAAWGGRPALNFTRPMTLPAKYVIISHTAGVLCKTFTTCCPILQAIQSYHVGTFKSPDIGYNFVIGGDANIYVGRGWDTWNFFMDSSISICFTGNFIYDYLTPAMANATKLLIELGVKLGKISKEYKLVAHNQTYASDSPGTHVYEEISTWPHFYPGVVIKSEER